MRKLRAESGGEWWGKHDFRKLFTMAFVMRRPVVKEKTGVKAEKRPKFF